MENRAGQWRQRTNRGGKMYCFRDLLLAGRVTYGSKLKNTFVKDQVVLPLRYRYFTQRALRKRRRLGYEKKRNYW
jgi:hypothetical protein